jgi:predicted AAA+ superfamily ATPase
MQIQRIAEIELLNRLLRNNPIVAILGPRQCGKTTLSRQLSSQWSKNVTIFDLEDPRDVQRLQEPLLALENIEGLIIIDEIQRCPDLFPVLRVLADRNKKTKYLILGSASRDLIRQSSESLAGRISYAEIGGFSIQLLGASKVEKLWIRGTFPRSFWHQAKRFPINGVRILLQLF